MLHAARDLQQSVMICIQSPCCVHRIPTRWRMSNHHSVTLSRPYAVTAHPAIGPCSEVDPRQCGDMPACKSGQALIHRLRRVAHVEKSTSTESRIRCADALSLPLSSVQSSRAKAANIIPKGSRSSAADKLVCSTVQTVQPCWVGPQREPLKRSHPGF